MDSKKWYLSKGMWAGIITALIGAATSIAQVFGIDLASNAIFGIIITILGALGLYARATANTTLK